MPGIEDITKAVGDVTATLADIKGAVEKQNERLAAMEKERDDARKRIRTPWAVGGGADEARRDPSFSPHFSVTALVQALMHHRGTKFSDGTPVPAPNKDALIRGGHFPDAVERAMSASILTSGGFLIPEEYMTDIIPALLPRARTLQLGVQTLNVGTGVGQIRWPKQNARPTVTAVTEAQAPTESTPTWQAKVAAPHKAGMLFAVPNEIFKMSNAAVEAFLKNQVIAKELAIEIDRQILRGTGSANEVLGLANTDNIQSVAVGANGGAITYNLILDLETQVRESNVAGTRFGWLTSPRGYREIRQVLDTQNRPIFIVTHELPGMAGASPTAILGFPILESTNVPTNISKGSGTNLTNLFFADWAESILVSWGGLDLRSSLDATDGTNNAFTQDLTLIRGFVNFDWVPFQETGMGLVPDMNSA